MKERAWHPLDSTAPAQRPLGTPSAPAAQSQVGHQWAEGGQAEAEESGPALRSLRPASRSQAFQGSGRAETFPRELTGPRQWVASAALAGEGSWCREDGLSRQNGARGA